MPAPAPQTSSRKKPCAITFFGLLAAGSLIAMPFIAGPPQGDKMPDMVRFIGHFHPVVLHLPIGVFILIILQELGAIFGRRNHDQVANTSMFPLFFGAASAILAVVFGFLMFQGSDDYLGNALAERHLWGGLIFAVAAIITFILKAWTVALSANPAFYRLLLFASVGIMGFASHDGASMTHGEDHLTKYAPDPIRVALGLKPKKGDAPVEGQPVVAVKPEDRIVYTDVVAPILERRCVQCHKEGKAKGKFRMDTYELLVKGGKEGAGLVPGKSAESNIIIRMELPEDDEEHMPPEGKPDIEDTEVAIVKWWIDNGADPKKALKDFQIPDALKEAIAKIAPLSAAIIPAEETEEKSLSHSTASGPDETLIKSLAAISKEFPGAVSFESQVSDLVTFTAVSLRANMDDAAFQKVAPVVSQLVTVDLTATKITDASVVQLESAKNLRLVRLAETGITDAAIDSLVKLPKLESINLYGTKITDAGVSKLAAMSQLKKLYLWKTAVTPEAIKMLREKLPTCEIITGTEA